MKTANYTTLAVLLCLAPATVQAQVSYETNRNTIISTHDSRPKTAAAIPSTMTGPRGTAVSAAASPAGARARSEPIVPGQLGAVAGKQYHGDGLSVVGTSEGARLRCVFQKLEGQVTREGLWLTSTTDPTSGERFRVVASAVGRVETEAVVGPHGRARQPQGPLDEYVEPTTVSGGPPCLANFGTVAVEDQTVRFTRPGLTEEYSVSVDGVRQDLVVMKRPKGKGQLRVELDVTGAKAEPLVNGARLVLDRSGRRIAYSRLRATDATGRELPARMEVACNSTLRTPHSSLGMAVVVDDADAVYPVRIDPTFSDADWISMGGWPGANARVNAAAVDGVGNLYIGGDFTAAGEVMANHVAKWNGSSWSALGSGVGDVGYPTVLALAVSGSDLYVGGRFTTAGGSAANNVAKWNGSSWSALGSGLGSPAMALAVSGSTLYVGGGFKTAGGSAANRVAKWNGSSWSALGSGLNGVVEALAVSGSDLYVGGDFETAGSSAANSVAKWDGSNWSALGSGIEGDYHTVYALAVSGNDLYVGGGFETAGGSAANSVAKWNGSSWSALGSGLDSAAMALAVSGGNLYVGGLFTTAGGSAATNVAKWNGSSWSGLGSSATAWNQGTPPHVSALAASGSDLYVGGSFTTVGGSGAYYVAKWGGSTWSALGWGMGNDRFPASVNALAVSGSDLYVGGMFTTVGGSAAKNVAKWNGSRWSALGSGIGGDYPSVNTLAVSGSDLYVGGDFTTAGGSAANRVAKWNGSRWSALGSGIGGDYPSVNALAVSGSDLYVGGYFTRAGGIAATNVAKWNGSSWSALGPGVAFDPGLDDPFPVALAVSGRDLYVGGHFTRAGGIAATNVAKWNGSSWSALGSGVSGYVFAVAVSGSDLYVGGYFTMAGGIAATNVAKWNGSSWSALGSGLDDYVSELVVSGSNLYAGGDFWSAGGSVANGLAKWNGSSWSALGLDNPGFSALAVLGSDLYVGGHFTTAGGKVSVCLARAKVDSAPPTVTITSPTLNQRWSNAVFSVRGTAKDDIRVAGVWCQTNGVWGVTTTANGWTNWAVDVALVPGTNVLRAYAVDGAGNPSTTNSVSFVYVLSDRLQVRAVGQGTLTPNYSDAVLEVGKSYTVTATAASGFAFTNWTTCAGEVLTNQPVIRFVMQSNLCVQANFVDVGKPTLAITAPTANQRWSNAPLFTVRGTAKDNVQVSNVWCQANNGGWGAATLGSGRTNWAIDVALVRGTNTVRACAEDAAGNRSLTNGVNLVYVIGDRLSVVATGKGTLSPNYSNAWLEIGRQYSMTAKASSGYAFTNWVVSTNWVGGVATNNATVQFIMQSNLTLRVSFADVTRPTNAIISPKPGQKVNAVMTATGTASDNAQVAAVKYQLNSNAWAVATGTTSWSAAMSLLKGTNVLRAYALDASGNRSTTNSVTFVSTNDFQMNLSFGSAQPLTGTGLDLYLQVTPGLNCRIESSADLVFWTTLTNLVGTNVPMHFRDAAAPNYSRRFYRAVTP